MKESQSFKRCERLKGSLRFKIVKRDSRPLKSDQLVMNVTSNGSSLNKLGISISSKHLPKSVERNRLKRYIRDIYRLKKNGLKKGYDIVIRANRVKKKFTSSDIEKELIGLFKKTGMLI